VVTEPGRIQPVRDAAGITQEALVARGGQDHGAGGGNIDFRAGIVVEGNAFQRTVAVEISRDSPLVVVDDLLGRDSNRCAPVREVSPRSLAER